MAKYEKQGIRFCLSIPSNIIGNRKNEDSFYLKVDADTFV